MDMTKLRLARKLSILRTLGIAARMRTWPPRILAAKGAHVSLARRSHVEGGGKLIVGLPWAKRAGLRSNLVLASDARLDVEKTFVLHEGCQVSLERGARLHMGSGYLNCDSTINCFDAISIGHDVIISKGVTIRDSDNHRILDGGEPTAPIIIEDHVWVGLNATILKGVRIGAGAVVAAGAVVVRDVPPHSLVGGVPARVLKENVEWV